MTFQNEEAKTKETNQNTTVSNDYVNNTGKRVVIECGKRVIIK